MSLKKKQGARDGRKQLLSDHHLLERLPTVSA